MNWYDAAKKRFLLEKDHILSSLSFYVDKNAGIYLGSEEFMKDTLRWHFVAFVANFDKFLHEFVHEGLVQVYIGKIPTTNAYRSFKVSFGLTQNVIHDVSWFSEKVMSWLTLISFQKWEKISNGISHVKEIDLAEKLRKPLGFQRPNDLVIKTNLFAQTRDQIVHECHIDPATMQKRNIEKDDVTAACDFYVQFVEELVKSF